MKICVVGLGYVGLPLAVFLSKHHQVTGFDIDTKKIASIQTGEDPSREISKEDLQNSTLSVSSDPTVLRDAGFIIVSVPTPIDEAHKPDLRALQSASKTIGEHLRKGAIVVYESTVYPGVTEDICAPILEQASGLKCGQDFKVGYSPERMNPGDKAHTVDKITKVVAGMDAESLKTISDVYSCVTTTYEAPSIRVAEAAKVIENVQRDLNIALVNELAILFDKLNINVHEVLKAAGTKWNFHNYYPGLVGGHCIGVDPYYLTYCARQLDHPTEIILAGRKMNDTMHVFYANKIIKQLINLGVGVKGAKIVVLGLTFKANVNDYRNSRVKNLIHELKSYGVTVLACDPLLTNGCVHDVFGVENHALDDVLGKGEMTVLAVKHDAFQGIEEKVPADRLFRI